MLTRALAHTHTHIRALARAHTSDVRPLGQVTTDCNAKPGKRSKTVLGLVLPATTRLFQAEKPTRYETTQGT